LCWDASVRKTSPIRSGVRSGLAAARAKDKRLGRPRVTADARRIATLRNRGRILGDGRQRNGANEGNGTKSVHARVGGVAVKVVP